MQERHLCLIQLEVWTRRAKLSWRGPIRYRRGPTGQNSEKS